MNGLALKLWRVETKIICMDALLLQFDSSRRVPFEFIVKV